MREVKLSIKQEIRGKQAFAVLFALGGAVSAETLAKALEIDKQEIPGIIEQLRDSVYCRPGSPLSVEEISGGYCLVTRPEYEAAVRRSGRPKQEKLSSAALETLAIIAWKQPITKTAIDELRNADSEKALGRLEAYGLINRIGDLSKPGSPGVFQTTGRFLEHFGLKDLQALPELNSPIP